MELQFFDPRQLIETHGSQLPHWQQGRCPQFVTFREKGSLPQSLLREIKQAQRSWLATHPEPHTPAERREFHQRFTAPLEQTLDQGHGRCQMRAPARRATLEEVLMHSQNDRVIHLSWVIMPNHVHLLSIFREPIDTMIKVWKGTSARRLGEGSLWQSNYRDTLIRNETHFRRVVRYIRENPRKLRPDEFTLWESGAVRHL